MNRELKFKAWNTATSIMMPWEDIKRFGNLTKLISLSHVYVLQYTGLKDKNRKEIYEGDIIKSGMTGAKYQVMFSEYMTKDSNGIGFWKKGIDGVHDRHILSDSDSQFIIGNIFENPELL